MSRAASSIFAMLLAAPLLGGCQTFIGIEDVQTHLPQLSGDYLLGLQHVRASDQMPEKIRMIGAVDLNLETRQLNLSFNILAADSGTELSENTFTNLVFPDGAAEVEFDIDFNIPAGAEERPVTVTTDRNVHARMLLRAQGEHAFCAEQIEPLPATVSIGSILLIDENVLPPPGAYDVDCDDL